MWENIGFVCLVHLREDGSITIFYKLETDAEIERNRPCGPGDGWISEWLIERGLLASSRQESWFACGAYVDEMRVNVWGH